MKDRMDSALQTDGKIVVAGRREALTAGFFEFVVARYNADGSLDTTFDGDGLFTLDVAGQFDSANVAAIQTDGKIVVASGVSGSISTAYITITRESRL